MCEVRNMADERKTIAYTLKDGTEGSSIPFFVDLIERCSEEPYLEICTR